MVQDSVAASAHKAYLSNSLPDLMHSITTYSYLAQPLAITNNDFQLQFTLSGTSYENFLFCFVRNADANDANSAPLSNNICGI